MTVTGCNPWSPCCTNPAPSLSAALAEGERKIDIWFARHQMAVVSFADQPDAFINLNSPDELAAYEARLPDSATGQGATS